MKPSLQLSISQHLTLTPQLQQAIRILQLSTIDLQQEIQLVLESNPLLEATPNEDKEEIEIDEPREQENDQNDFQWSELYQSSDKRTSFEENDYNFDNLHCTTTNLKRSFKMAA
ncbi:RNA polymerase sigma-54 factor (sigma-L) [Legionella sainthelensi]|nr:RNA polymerase sigma-54 factor (sigma-L) [Legionella sainthelensi]